MILSDFIVNSKEGLYCKYADFYLDPQVPVKNAVISHAHGDHAKAGNQNIYCSAFTADLMRLRFKKNAGATFQILDYHQNFEIGEVQLELLPAGHILGSAMVKMTYQNCIYLYTGDFKLQADETCEAAVLCKADVLITETTFAHPATQHPNPETEIAKLNNISGNIMLGVYGLGKAQRITQLINKHCLQKKIHLHYSIFPVHQLYQKHGVNLGSFQHYDRKWLKNNNQQQVYMVPPLTFRSYRNAFGVTKIFASGWQNLQHGNDETLFISDHADWQEILDTVKEVNPSEIWTTHGEGEHLKAYFRTSLRVKIL